MFAVVILDYLVEIFQDILKETTLIDRIIKLKKRSMMVSKNLVRFLITPIVKLS